MSSFHLRNNLYFERQQGGGVRVVKYAPGATAHAIAEGRIEPSVDETMTDAEWESVARAMAGSEKSKADFFDRPKRRGRGRPSPPDAPPDDGAA